MRGPVLGPPCIRQRPFGMAGSSHGVPFRVLAPHFAAFERSPGGLPFLSQPRRCAWGLSTISAPTPFRDPRRGTGGDDSLTTRPRSLRNFRALAVRVPSITLLQTIYYVQV